MKKYLLSFLVIAASGGYVWYARSSLNSLNAFPEAAISQPDAGPVLSLPTHLSVLKAPAVPVPAAPQQQVPPTGTPPTPGAVASEPPRLPTLAANDPPADAPALPEPSPMITGSTVPVPMPRLRPARQAAVAPPSPPAPQVAAAPPLPTGQYRDGAYAGPTVDAYYGWVQVRAVVQGGKLVSVDILQYPSERRTSARINKYALPRLKREVLIAQSASVDIISGATLTSRAYRRSLDEALAAART